MNKTFVVIILLFIVATVSAQPPSIDSRKIHFEGQSFFLLKAQVIARFGEPRIEKVNYGCGYFSSEQPDGPFYKLMYEGFNYIGNDKGKFALEIVDFDANGKLKIFYGEEVLSSSTTRKDFSKVFGADVGSLIEKHPDDDIYL